MFKFGYKGTWYINLLILLVLQTLCIAPVSAKSVIHNGQIESVRIDDSVATICWATTIFCGDSILLELSVNYYGTDTLLAYTWSPASGLNDPYIPNPTAYPTNTTTYAVSVTDGT